MKQAEIYITIKAICPVCGSHNNAQAKNKADRQVEQACQYCNEIFQYNIPLCLELKDENVDELAENAE